MTRTERLRTQLQWSQRDMARFFGITQPPVFRLEAGMKEYGPIARLLDQLEAALAHERLQLPVTPEQALAVLMPGKDSVSSAAAE